jgi:hypothetical protein
VSTQYEGGRGGGGGDGVPPPGHRCAPVLQGVEQPCCASIRARPALGGRCGLRGIEGMGCCCGQWVCRVSREPAAEGPEGDLRPRTHVMPSALRVGGC